MRTAERPHRVGQIFHLLRQAELSAIRILVNPLGQSFEVLALLEPGGVLESLRSRFAVKDLGHEPSRPAKAPDHVQRLSGFKRTPGFFNDPRITAAVPRWVNQARHGRSTQHNSSIGPLRHDLPHVRIRSGVAGPVESSKPRNLETSKRRNVEPKRCPPSARSAGDAPRIVIIFRTQVDPAP